MANTTNFGWETPDDTDLVKDGASAMRTLGNSIDASFVDLKGGTSGQILSKNSNTDLDFVWIANDQGDITAVTAGTGLTGGGTAGAVTLTNDMATTITASGDIVVGTGSGTYDNLPIGTTGQVLTADTTVSPYKVKWAAAPSPTFAGCRLYSSTNFTISNNTLTVLNWDTESFDVGGYHSTSTNTNRITVPSGKAGYYFIDSCISYQSNTTGVRESRLRLNGSVVFYNYQTFSNGEFVMWNSITLYMAEGDWVELAAYQTSGGNLSVYGGSTSSMFSAQYLGA